MNAILDRVPHVVVAAALVALITAGVKAETKAKGLHASALEESGAHFAEHSVEAFVAATPWGI